jgi:pyruvate formate lyase activating enzyme
VCPDGALRLVGRHYTPGALAELVLRDRAFYERSGGGVTLSGGEPTLFPAYLESFVSVLKAEGLHVVLQTCGYFHYEAFRRRILPYVDLVYYDVKLADPKAHRRYTGRSNDRILANLRRLLREEGVVVEPRLPLVPGITATADNLAAVVDLLCDMGARSLQLLPYNPLGLEMWSALGRPTPSVTDRFMTQDEERHIYETFQEILRSKAVQL